MATQEQLEREKLLQQAFSQFGGDTPAEPAAAPQRDVRAERLAEEAAATPIPLPRTQPVSASTQPIPLPSAASQQPQQDPLMQYQQQIAAARQAEITAQQESVEQFNSINNRPRIKFLKKGQSFMDAFTNPSEAQRAFAFNAGLALLSSNGTNNLSQRIGQALGAGASAMTTQREKELSREQQLSKLNLAALKSKREAAEKGFGTYMQVKGEERSQAGEVRAGERQGFARTAEERAAKNQIIKDQAAFNARADRAVKVGKERLEKQRGFLTPAQFQTNQSIMDARGIISDALNNGVTQEQIAMMQRARVQANQEGIPEGMVEGYVRKQMESFMGAKTIPNELFNRPFMDALETASKPLFDAGGKSDYNARAFLDILTGSPSGPPGPKPTGTRIPAPKNITRKMVTDLAAEYRKQNPSLTQAQAEEGAEAALRNR